jgi:hypothetical protein
LKLNLAGFRSLQASKPFHTSIRRSRKIRQKALRSFWKFNEISMKRTFEVLSVLSLAFVMSIAAFGQTPSTQQPKPEHLSKQQLNTLIATAKTPAEHGRVAQYYQAKAVDYSPRRRNTRQSLRLIKQIRACPSTRTRQAP